MPVHWWKAHWPGVAHVHQSLHLCSQRSHIVFFQPTYIFILYNFVAMAHAQRSYPSRDQAADNADSPDSTTLPPFRKLSSLLPKPTRGLSLPALTDIISFDERAGAPARNHSLPNPPEFFIPGVSVPYLDDRPLKQYFIEGKSYIMQKPENENHNEYIRTTVGGRRLKYELQVIQNPKKARACGNGPKGMEAIHIYVYID